MLLQWFDGIIKQLLLRLDKDTSVELDDIKYFSFNVLNIFEFYEWSYFWEVVGVRYKHLDYSYYKFEHNLEISSDVMLWMIDTTNITFHSKRSH